MIPCGFVGDENDALKGMCGRPIKLRDGECDFVGRVKWLQVKGDGAATFLSESVASRKNAQRVVLRNVVPNCAEIDYHDSAVPVGIRALTGHLRGPFDIKYEVQADPNELPLLQITVFQGNVTAEVCGMSSSTSNSPGGNDFKVLKRCGPVNAEWITPSCETQNQNTKTGENPTVRITAHNKLVDGGIDDGGIEIAPGYLLSDADRPPSEIQFEVISGNFECGPNRQTPGWAPSWFYEKPTFPNLVVNNHARMEIEPIDWTNDALVIGVCALNENTLENSLNPKALALVGLISVVIVSVSVLIRRRRRPLESSRRNPGGKRLPSKRTSTDSGIAEDRLKANDAKNDDALPATNASTDDSVLEKASTKSKIDLLILTVKTIEFDAVIDALGLDRSQIKSSKSRVELRDSMRIREDKSYEIVVLRLREQKDNPMAAHTASALATWNVHIAILVGIAGAAQKAGDVLIGDVIIATKVWNLDGGKLVGDRTQKQSDSVECHKDLLAKQEDMTEAWDVRLQAERPPEIARNPKPHRGDIALSTMVLAAAVERDKVKDTQRSVIAIDMESYGFSTAITQSEKPPMHFVIRGVSDYADEKKIDKYQPYAAESAAKYLYYLLHNHFLD